MLWYINVQLEYHQLRLLLVLVLFILENEVLRASVKIFDASPIQLDQFLLLFHNGTEASLCAPR